MGDRHAEATAGRPDPHTVTTDPLEAAYRRIREVRRSLLELSVSMSSQSPAQDNSFDPGHEAIYLANHNSSTSGPSRQVSPISEAPLPSRPAVDTLPPFPSYGFTYRRPVPVNAERRSAVPRYRPSLPLVGNSQTAEVEAALTRLRTTGQSVRRSIAEGSYPLRDNDDSRTALGRRVAAREAASQRSRARDGDRIPLEQVSADLYGGIEDLQNRLHSLLARVMDRPSSPSMPPLEYEPSRPSANAGQSIQAEEVPFNPDTAQRVFNPIDVSRRIEPIRTDHASRLSALSSLTAQNFSTPSSILSAERALLFDEPTSYLDEPPTDGQFYPSSDRSYVIRRTFVDGREVVHTIPTPPPDAMAWMMPPQPPTSQTAHRIAERPRRTGQPRPIPDRISRLDLDGNEISTIVEEELDDPPYELIVRIRRSNSGQTVTGSGPTPPTRHSSSREWPPRRRTSVMPQAWPVPIPALDQDPDIVHRAPFHPEASAHGLASSVIETALTHHATLRRNSGPLQSTSIPLNPLDLHINPLPMPLSEMTPSQNYKEGRTRAQPISLSTHDQAQLVCR